MIEAADCEQRERSWWLDYHRCEEEWPWRIRVLNPDRISKLSDDAIPPSRVRCLIEASHSAAHSARLEGSTAIPDFLDPPGGWQSGEKEFAAKLFARERPPGFWIQDIADTFSVSGAGRRAFSIPWTGESNPFKRMGFYINFLDEPVVWEVPHSEWTFIRDDFVPCLAFPVHEFHFMPAGEEAEPYPSYSGFALHRATGTRDIPAKSVNVWQAKELLIQVQNTYHQHGLEIRSRWRYTSQPDPAYRFIANPSREACRELKLFLNQQLEIPRTARDSIESTARETITPQWDSDRSELFFENRCIRRVRRIARWVPILDAFEEEGWPRRIDNPLPPDVDLSESLRTLNSGLERLHFKRDGAGEGIMWELVNG